MRDDPMPGTDRPTTTGGELVARDSQGIDPAMRAAAAALERMSEDGRSGKVTMSVSVEIEHAGEHDLTTPAQLAERREAARRFALGLAAVCGVLSGLLAASFSFVPGPLALLVGVVVAAWVYGELKP